MPNGSGTAIALQDSDDTRYGTDGPRRRVDVHRRITTTIDTRAVVDRKRAALHCHASQLDSSIAGRLPPAEFAEALGVEDFVRARDTTGSPVPETDLFAGL